MNRRSDISDDKSAVIALTPGEPAGIGPDLCVMLAQGERRHDLVAVADPQLLEERARQLGLPLDITAADGDLPRAPGTLAVLPVELPAPAVPGRLDPRNAHYVLQCLRRAADGCLSGRFHALVTGPVHKGVINEAGVQFSGHTEFLADLTGAERVVMMLATPLPGGETLRVALATTHLPLAEVPRTITWPHLETTLRILDRDLRRRFGIAAPRVLVCGLNPHAGEGGHLGREELTVIGPLLDALRDEGYELEGPVAADTAFNPKALAGIDAVLTMYHDQGLPVLKRLGFGRAVNVTLGLPIIRTSVDHGTALELAGSGRAEVGSLEYAIEVALDMNNTD